MKNYKLTLAYDGTAYSGWQVQPNALTIQEVLHKVLRQILQEEVYLVGSGRTDAGVHALEQVAHMKVEKTFDQNKLFMSLNRLLPDDIRVLSLDEVADDFHARYSAVGKIYHFHLHTGIRDPFQRHYSLQVKYPINLELLQAAAKKFVGKHDFTSFANEAHRGSASNGAVRTMKRLDVIIEGDDVRLEFEANGFLYKMVRNITGTLLDVARGKLPLESIEGILEAKDRRVAGKAAPPNGLFLVKVFYRNGRDGR